MVGRKVLFIAIIILLSNSFLSAQDALKQGVYYLSGAISFSSSSNQVNDFYKEKTESMDFAVQPSFNYFIIDNLSFGAGITFWYSETEHSYQNHSHKYFFRAYGIGPNIRYYFPGSTNLIPLIGASASYIKPVLRVITRKGTTLLSLPVWIISFRAGRQLNHMFLIHLVHVINRTRIQSSLRLG